jgi:hypothetical protein
MSASLVEWRVLGAIRGVDSSTKLPITDPLVVQAPGVRFIRNRRSEYVMADARSFHNYVRAFQKPPEPPPAKVTFDVTITDPRRQFLPRRQKVTLPRDPSAARPLPEGSVFTPIDVSMVPAPTWRVAPGWAVIRARVMRNPTKRIGVGNALVRVLPKTGDTPLAYGLTDAQTDVRMDQRLESVIGEALVPVPGVQMTNLSDEPDGSPLLTLTVDIRVEAVALVPQKPDVLVPDIVDPDDIEKNRRRPEPQRDIPDMKLAITEQVSKALSYGQTETVELFLNLP